jgi:hypothetical protein
MTDYYTDPEETINDSSSYSFVRMDTAIQERILCGACWWSQHNSCEHGPLQMLVSEGNKEQPNSH